jgi:hypothetical protein
LLPNEDEIAVLDPGPVHRVAANSQDEIGPSTPSETGRDWDVRFHVLCREDRLTGSNLTDQGNRDRIGPVYDRTPDRTSEHADVSRADDTFDIPRLFQGVQELLDTPWRAKTSERLHLANGRGNAFPGLVPNEPLEKSQLLWR